MTVSPCIDGDPFILFKPVLLSSLHLNLDPVHTNQSLTGFVVISGLALPGLFLSMLMMLM